MLPRGLIKRLGTFEIDHFDFEGNFQPDTLSYQNAAGRKTESGAATPTRRVAGRLSISILPAGTRDTLTQTRTHGFGHIAICGLQRYFGDRGRCPEGPPPRHRRQLPRAHHQHLQDMAPRHRPTHRRRTCLYIIHRCQGRPTLRNRLGCRCRVLHCSRPAPKVGDQNARARRPSPHQKSAFLHHLARQH